MRSLKIAVIGCGPWGLNHARVFKEVEGAELVAVSDVDPARAKLAGARFGVDWYTSNEELFRRKDLDAVTICTPSSTHAEVALQAVERGLDVLVEKPLATSAEEALRLVRAAEREGVRLAVGHIERFNPGVRRVKSILEERRICLLYT
ncbi:MAG: Gfo/Idh/MocA family oxidoreductase, partial [Candidatus Nezhaarchaeota archaeon]|nr:Gfo/Idh/MocA family oxidoreductase [Candidatus Nezhaarchaeota archaeon]